MRNLKTFATAIVLLLLALTPASALETTARAALVVDHNTGTVLLSKNAETPLPPASMSKLMTLNMLFEALDDGRITMDTQFRTSEKASKMGGSKMFLRDGERVTVRDLIQGVIVHSGNDACVVIAEGMAGTEDAFADLMTKRARAMGMKNSTFGNASGFPHPAQRMSAADLVTLARHIITEFPEYYGFFSQRSFTWDDITQKNRNPLLALDIGADGLKTGHTEEAGYGLVGSAKQGDRRIVFMLTGLDSSAARLQESERLVNWAFRQFVQKKILEAGEEVGRAAVWMGQERSVALSVADDLNLLVPASAGSELKADVIFNEPVEAPIARGQELGRIVIRIPDMETVTYPLVASEAVARGGLGMRLKASAITLMRKAIGD